MSDIIEVDYNKTNDSWMDITSASLCDDVKSFECDVCKKPFKFEKKLKRHVEKFHAKVAKKLLKKGLFVGKKLKLFPKAMERKVLTPVVGENGFQCHLCHKNFLSQETRDKHLVSIAIQLH